MKKLLLSVIALFLMCGAVSAQEKVQWGFKAGMNRATEYDGNGNTEARPSALYAGLFIDVPIDRTTSIQPELVYSMQGAKSSGLFSSSRNYIDKLDYINVPVMIKLYLIKHTLSIDVGPQFGYLISAKAKMKSGNYSEPIDLKSYIDHKFDVALAAGFSCTIAGAIDISLRYNYGLIKPVERLENRNRVLQLGIGARF